MYHSWFSLDGVSDFGDVTLACDDDKRIQAHEVYLATGSVGSSLSSTTGFSWTLRYIWPLLQAPSPLVPQAGVSTTVSVGVFGHCFSWLLVEFYNWIQLDSSVYLAPRLVLQLDSVGLFGIFGRSCRLLFDGRFGWSN